MKYSGLIFLLFFEFFLNQSIPQWQQTGSYTGDVLSFAVIDSVFIAGTYGNGAYITTDGINWSYSTNGMTDLKIISQTVCGNYFFAGSEAGGIYRSSNNGLNWTPVNNGITNMEIHTMCSSNGKIYSGTNSGIHLSTDYGNNWSRISFSPVGNVIYALESFGDTVFTGNSNGVFYSVNGGTNWNYINTGIGGAVYYLMKYGNSVYAGTSSYGIYKTSNLGANWIHINTGLTSSAIRGMCYNSGKIFAATYGAGVYYSTNEGTSWLASNTGLSQLVCYNVKSYRNYLFCGTTGGIFKRPLIDFSAVIIKEKGIVNQYKLLDNYPNPFNPSTYLRYELPKNCFVTIKIFDNLGRLVKILINEKQDMGRYKVKFIADGLSSGIYFYRLTSDDFSETKRMIFIK
jgi:photosystem II stability/assembly factor-like uncharacterized protein